MAAWHLETWNNQHLIAAGTRQLESYCPADLTIIAFFLKKKNQLLVKLFLKKNS